MLQEASPVRWEGASRSAGVRCARRAGPASADGGSTWVTRFRGEKSLELGKEGRGRALPAHRGNAWSRSPPSGGVGPRRRSSDFGGFLLQAALPSAKPELARARALQPRAELPLTGRLGSSLPARPAGTSCGARGTSPGGPTWPMSIPVRQRQRLETARIASCA